MDGDTQAKIVSTHSSYIKNNTAQLNILLTRLAGNNNLFHSLIMNTVQYTEKMTNVLQIQYRSTENQVCSTIFGKKSLTSTSKYAEQNATDSRMLQK